ncbi:Myosin light chain kinase, smooth muscle [Halotydeus destructor]|nr:Myosin light chain kinase, smooth muscle [Halotydeus destructor]
MHTEMITSVKLYGDDVKVTDAWDAVQRNLHCCGILPAINNTDGGSIKRALDRKPYEVWFKEGTFPSQKLPLSCCLAVTANPAPPLGTQQDPKRKGMQECSVKDDIYRDWLSTNLWFECNKHTVSLATAIVGLLHRCQLRLAAIAASTSSVTMIRVSEADSDDEDSLYKFEPRKILVKRSDPKHEYTLQEELGRGKFGVVHRCSEKATGRKLAAKFVSILRQEDRDDVEREVDIMKCLQHKRLLQLHDAYDDGTKEMCLILELIEGGELFERVISDDFLLTEKSCSVFMRQICEGVEYIHSQNIIHLDMKPENVLCVTKMGNRIKIIDFGLARRYDPKKKLQVMFGTPEFVAPEVVNFERITFKTDMWSVGVICYVLLSGLSPFMGDSDLETMANVTTSLYDFDDEAFDPISDEAKDFIKQLLIKDMDQRMSASQCLQHAWLRRDRKKSMISLDKSKLRKFVVRRRWQRAVNAILALKRMGANLAL